MPSLQERREDVPELARSLLAGACAQHTLARLELSAGALRAIEADVWPGNVRQLGHAVEVAAIRAAGEGATQVEATHVFPDAAEEPAEGALTFQEATRRFQRELLERSLRETDWNVAETARRLDLARSHVYNLIGAFGLSRDSSN